MMDQIDENQSNEHGKFATQARTQRWLILALILLLGVAGIAVSYGVHEHNQALQLQQQAATTASAMTQLQTQVTALTSRLNDTAAAQAASPNGQPPEAANATTTPVGNQDEHAETSLATLPVIAAPKPAAKPAPAKRAAAKHRATVDKRYAQLQAQLDEQKKQLKDTQDEVAKNRTDLEGSINSTRDELNGSIAKTHDELVALQKRGERSYFEFDLSKSKQFQRVGPLTLSLRKSDTKHKNFDLAMIVDDNELNKKKVNLYEPIWIHTENGSQPIQVVVNRIEKNLVHGYVSAPKYKASELAALGSANAGVSPAADTATQQAQQPLQ